MSKPLTSPDLSDEARLRIVETFDAGVAALITEIAAQEDVDVGVIDILLAEAGFLADDGEAFLFPVSGRLQ